MSRCGCLFMLAIYIRRFIPILFCHLSSECLFPDFGSSLRRLVSKMSDWPSLVGWRGPEPLVFAVRGGFNAQGARHVSDVCADFGWGGAMDWKKFLPMFFFDMLISKVFEGVHHHLSRQEVWWNIVKRGCVLEQFGSDFLKQLISAGVLKQSVFFFGGFIYSKHTTALLMYRRIVYILNTLYKNYSCWHIGPSRTRILGIECLSPASFGSDSGNPERVVPVFPFINLS